MSELNIPGLADLNKVLQELPAKIERNILRGALRAGQKVILNAAKANIHNKSGDLRDSLSIKTTSRRGVVTATLSAGSGSAYYARMVEFGTAAHWISVKEEAKPKRLTRRGVRTFSIRTINRMAARGSLVIGRNFIGASVHHPGATPKPFMRPALDSAQLPAVEAVREYIATRLPKEIKKAGL